MSVESGGNFFSRWSKRKLADQPAAEAKIDVPLQTPNPPVDGHLQAKMPETADQSASLPKNSQPPPPLPSIESLTPQSDFSAFMAPDISPELRNQAMKKLFTDPHYNVMDRLDIYIDDYNKPDPLPASWLKNMNQSKALRLFDDDEEEEKKQTDANTTAALPAVEDHPAVSAPEAGVEPSALAPVVDAAVLVPPVTSP